VTVPLSEREQRILDEMEKSLYQEDPVFAREPAHRPGSAGMQSARRGLLMFVAGLLVLFAFFMTKQVWIGALAFGSMVWGIVVIAGSVRGGGSSPRRTFTDVGERIGRAASDFEQRLKDRYKRR
jgi:VIT1/CCC1 family predicted Fe2+/Mn2+ transporter